MDREPSLFILAVRSFWALFGGIWLLVGVPFLILGGYFAAEEFPYRQKGEWADGIVLELRQATKEIGPLKIPYHAVRYRFATREGQTREGQTNVWDESWATLREQGPARVQYLGGDPATNRLDPQKEMGFVFIFPLVGGALTVVGGLLFVKGMRQAMREKRLMREGATTAATVSEVIETNVSLNRVRQCVVYFTFHDHQGREHSGKSYYMSPEEAQAWKEGDTGTVRFDTQDPSLNLWMGKGV